MNVNKTLTYYLHLFAIVLNCLHIFTMSITTKQTKKQNIMQTFSTLLMVAQFTIFAAFLVTLVRLVHSLITNK